VLVGVSDVFDWACRMQSNGIRGDKLVIDWQELMRFKRSFTEPVPKNREKMFAKVGIATFHGRARFVGRSIQVGQDTFERRYVVIAAGQKPCRF
jgi:glutathione reductase (NADPH)